MAHLPRASAPRHCSARPSRPLGTPAAAPRCPPSPGRCDDAASEGRGARLAPPPAQTAGIRPRSAAGGSGGGHVAGASLCAALPPVRWPHARRSAPRRGCGWRICGRGPHPGAGAHGTCPHGVECAQSWLWRRRGGGRRRAGPSAWRRPRRRSRHERRGGRRRRSSGGAVARGRRCWCGTPWGLGLPALRLFPVLRPCTAVLPLQSAAPRRPGRRRRRRRGRGAGVYHSWEVLWSSGRGRLPRPHRCWWLASDVGPPTTTAFVHWRRVPVQQGPRGQPGGQGGGGPTPRADHGHCRLRGLPASPPRGVGGWQGERGDGGTGRGEPWPSPSDARPQLVGGPFGGGRDGRRGRRRQRRRRPGRARPRRDRRRRSRGARRSHWTWTLRRRPG